jgi:hypothetical protein
MANNFIAVDQTKRLGGNAMQAAQNLRWAQDQLSALKIAMDNMIAASDYSVVEAQFGLPANKGQTFYTGGGLTWNPVETQGPTAGTFANIQGAYIWEASSAGALSGQTVTVSWTGGTNTQSDSVLSVFSITSAGGVGAHTGAQDQSGATAALSLVVNAQGVNSLILGGSVGDNSTAQTALANTTINAHTEDATLFAEPAVWQKTTTTASTGNVTVGCSSNEGNYSKAAIEILDGVTATANPPAPRRFIGPMRGGPGTNPIRRFRSLPGGEPPAPTPDQPPPDPRPRGPFRRGGPNPVGRFRSTRFIDPPASAGTTFFQNLDGTLTSSGNLIRQTGKALGGTLTSSGSLLKLVAKVLAGTLSMSGALVKLITKSFAGTLTSAGSLIKQVGKVLGGTLTSSGTLTVIKVALRSFGGTLSMSGTLLKQVQKPLGGTMTSAGALLRQTQKGLAGTLSSSGGLLKLIGKLFSGTITSSGVVTITKVVLKAFAGTLSMSGTLTRQTGKALAGSLSSSGAIVRRISKGVAGVLAPAGTLTKRIARTFSGALSFLGSLVVSFRPPNVDNILDPVVLLQAAREAIVLTPAARDAILLAQTCPATSHTNMLLSPEAIGDGNWSLLSGNISVQVNAGTAPDGTNHASLCIATGAHALLQVATVVPGQVYTFSFFAKNAGGSRAAYSVFDVTHGADIVPATSYIAQLNGTSFVRVRVTFTAPAGCTTVNVYPIRDSGTIVDVLLWGAKLEPGTAATGYVFPPDPPAITLQQTARDPVLLTQPARDPIVLKTRS